MHIFSVNILGWSIDKSEKEFVVGKRTAECKKKI
jgi:hypothetical protein